MPDTVELTLELPREQVERIRQASGTPDERAAVTTAVDRYAQQLEADTDPASLFRSFRETVASAGGAVPVRLVDEELAVVPRAGQALLLGLDEDDLMAVREMPRRELLEQIEAGVRTLSDDELLAVLADAERERLELLAVPLIGELRERSEE